MATYVIGDVQGCFYAFQDLLAKLNFDEAVDRLWLVGDMVNRGGESLAMLRWCVLHQHCLQVVLGNHDLHTLVVASGLVKPRKNDTLAALLNAHDKDELLTWLRQQPLMYQEGDYTMVHAGLLPQWSINEALSYAKEVESVLKSDGYADFFAHMYGNSPKQWQADLAGMDRLRLITNAFTRLRICSNLGVMEFDFKGELTDIPQDYMPWFDVPSRASRHQKIVFGHWSALGLQHRNNVYALDTGCLWGGNLTALQLETETITQVPFNAKDQPLLNHLS